MRPACTTGTPSTIRCQHCPCQHCTSAHTTPLSLLRLACSVGKGSPFSQEIPRKIFEGNGCAALTGIGLQVLRYAPGQFYKSHSDFIQSQVEQPSGPRLFTFFLYLRDVEEGKGGQTFFPQVCLSLLFTELSLSFPRTFL